MTRDKHYKIVKYTFSLKKFRVREWCPNPRQENFRVVTYVVFALLDLFPCFSLHSKTMLGL
jgi:hypothetical protein